MAHASDDTGEHYPSPLSDGVGPQVVYGAGLLLPGGEGVGARDAEQLQVRQA